MSRASAGSTGAKFSPLKTSASGQGCASHQMLSLPSDWRAIP